MAGDALDAVNAPGLAALRRYLAAGDAVAFLGAGVSRPLYPLWSGVVGDLIGGARARGMSEQAAQTCLALAADQPDAVIEVVRSQLGEARYLAALRETFRVRVDPETARTWTPVQELVCRCPFKAVVTTNYDPGIADARMRVRPTVSSTGFTIWTDELGLDRWRTGDVYGEIELPILYAHGQHNQPETIVLATTEYRRAYAGKLAHVLADLIRVQHLVWIGFSFADQRVGAILREVAEHAGTPITPGTAPRHVAIMPWDPDGGRDPQTLRHLAEISYGADLVLYPAPGDDHSALAELLAAETGAHFPPVPDLTRTTATAAATVSRWVPGVDEVPGFAGRVEELARLDRWAADPTVRLIGVSAWGGAGKTALVTHWLHGDGLPARPGVRGVFGWSFYADPSPEHWAEALLDWAGETFGVRLFTTGGRRSTAVAVIALLRALPLVLVLDGLEVAQEGPASDAYGRLLDGALREILTAACRVAHRSLIVLTSRFPFADLAGHDGTTARMLDVPAFTPAEGAALLAAAAPHSPLSDPDRRRLVAQVDGHALAVVTLGGLLAEHPERTLAELPASLREPGSTQAKVNRVLQFYADRLTEADRYLVAAVSLFTRPATPEQLLALVRHEAFGGRLRGWTAWQVRAAASGRLSGLLSATPDGLITAHPLVRQTFRPLAWGAAQVAVDTALAGTPDGTVTDRAHAVQVVEAVELLLDADQWAAADDLYRSRTGNGQVWKHLPAVRLGQRTATAFVATPARQESCRSQLGVNRRAYYLNAVGLWAQGAGDVNVSLAHLVAAVEAYRAIGRPTFLSIALQNLADCRGHRGNIQAAMTAAAESLVHATAVDDRQHMRYAHCYRGWLAGQAGDVRTAEQHFLAGDRIEFADLNNLDHLCSVRGVYWAEFLARTGRPGSARRLTTANHTICTRNGWHEDVARCRVTLARLDLADRALDTAGDHLEVALRTFRDGDFLLELSGGLVVAADHARLLGDVERAADHLAEALSLAAPRRLVPAHTAALAVRAHLAADRHTATGVPDHLFAGRDAADAALRMATAPEMLPWHQLAALRAHAHLDRTEGTDRGWAGRAERLTRQLIPADLDPDPLTTVEDQVRSGWREDDG